MSGPTRRRAAAVLLGSLAIGLLAQLDRTLSWTDAAGTLAYAGAAVGLLGVLLPRRGAWLPGALGTLAACAVEVFQLTGLPLAVAEQVPPLALLLGTRFSAVDLLVLGLGGILATAVLAVRARPPRSTPAG